MAPKGSFVLRLYTRLRSLFGIVVVIPHTVIFSVLVILVSVLGTYSGATLMIRCWGIVVLKLFGIRVQTSGENHLPTSGGGIVAFNHQSLFDIPVLMVATNKDIRFGAKIELFKIPFFGAAMRAAGTLPIARENRSEVMRIYKQAEVRFGKQNALFVLAPEGTRQKEPQIGRFKKGPFIFAMNAGVPIIPAVIKGTHAVLPKKSLTINIGRLRRTIYVEFLPAISTQGLKPESIDSLVDSTRAAMIASYERLPPDA